MAAASHFTPIEGATTGMLIREEGLRQATGLAAGRTSYMAPERPTLNADGGLTCGSLIEWSERSLPELKRMLNCQAPPHTNYYRGWGDAAKPMALAEVSQGALDKVISIADAQLRRELFSSPLPIYETPWLERAPPQRLQSRSGCEHFVAQVALDLLDERAKRDLRSWFSAAKKDAICLEGAGSARSATKVSTYTPEQSA